jgi:hypothetical protein
MLRNTKALFETLITCYFNLYMIRFVCHLYHIASPYAGQVDYAVPLH